MKCNVASACIAVLISMSLLSCTKKDTQQLTTRQSLPELLSSKGGNGIDTIVPLEIAQKAWLTEYVLNRSNYTATISSLDTMLDKGVFKILYNYPDSAFISFTCQSLQPLYLKMIKRAGRDSITVIYNGIVYDLESLSFDSVSKSVRNTAAYAALMYFDVLDHLAGTTPRSVYNCNCNRAIHMTAVGVGGTASASQRRAEYSQVHWVQFWGCSNVRISGTDTSCWPANSHGLCVTTIEYTADCPWYAIPFGLA